MLLVFPAEIGYYDWGGSTLSIWSCLLFQGKFSRWEEAVRLLVRPLPGVLAAGLSLLASPSLGSSLKARWTRKMRLLGSSSGIMHSSGSPHQRQAWLRVWACAGEVLGKARELFLLVMTAGAFLRQCWQSPVAAGSVVRSCGSLDLVSHQYSLA